MQALKNTNIADQFSNHSISDLLGRMLFDGYLEDKRQLECNLGIHSENEDLLDTRHESWYDLVVELKRYNFSNIMIREIESNFEDFLFS